MIIFDIETERPVLGKNETPRPGIEYAGGWTDYLAMGIACLCAYDTIDGRAYAFGKGDLEGFGHLTMGRMVAGYNIVDFDLRLLDAHGIHVYQGEWYDLLREVHRGCGRRISLDKLAQANGLPGKAMNGAMAPIEWQRGNQVKVVSYCLSDVCTTRDLITSVEVNGFLFAPDGSRIEVRRPQL